MTDQQSSAPCAAGLETTPALPVPAAVTTVDIQVPPEPKHTRARNGKVARLPKAIRDRLNWMMLDSIPYRQIIQDLGPRGRHLTENCLSTWKTGGHQDFLKELRLLDEYRVRHELTLDLAREDRGIDVFQAANKIAASLICQAVAEVGADTLRQAVQANPLNLLRMLNSLSRVTTGGLKCQSLLDSQADRAARRQQQKPARGKKGLSKAVVQEMNDKLNLM
jgi:hypothetical protein